MKTLPVLIHNKIWKWEDKEGYKVFICGHSCFVFQMNRYQLNPFGHVGGLWYVMDYTEMKRYSKFSTKQIAINNTKKHLSKGYHNA